MTSTNPDDRLLEELRDPADRVAAAARRMTPLDADLEQPPGGLWNRIADDLGMARDQTDTGGDQDPGQIAEIVAIGGWRRFVRPVLVAAAVLVVVAVGVGTLVSSGEGEGDTSALATAQLEPLGESGSGTAELVSTGEGELALAIDFTGVEAADGFFEVWLLNEEVTQLVSLGPARSDGLYQVPVGLDPSDVPVVDISLEVFDGDPSHGGNSVLRGLLNA